MFYIIENSHQLKEVTSYIESAIVQVIPNNYNYHPKLQQVCLIYFKPLNSHKGYLLCINHSESYSLSLQEIIPALSSIKNIFTLNKKETLYFLPLDNLYDINFIQFINNKNIITTEEFNTPAHTFYYNRFFDKNNLNHIISLSKHYEKYENLFLSFNIDIPTIFTNEYKFYNEELIPMFFSIENNGIKISKSKFKQYFNNCELDLFNNSNTIYSQYNLYNTTLRPSNCFNSINFAALNKENNEREVFIPKNDLIVEFDFKSYHLYILSELVGYNIKNQDIHTELGKIYFNKENLTSEEYNESKQKTFNLIYTSKIKDYLHIEFFQKIEQYKNKIWSEYRINKNILGAVTKFNNIKSQTQILPYLLQNYETYINTKILKQIQEYLKTKKTQLILYNYDAFVFDFSKSDTKQCLIDIQNILEQQGKYKCNISYGPNYNALKKI